MKIKHLLKNLQSTISVLQDFKSQLIAFSTINGTMKMSKNEGPSPYCSKCKLSRLLSTRNLPTKCCNIGHLQNRKSKCRDFTVKLQMKTELPQKELLATEAITSLRYKIMKTEMTTHEKNVFKSVNGDSILYKCILATEKSKQPLKLIYEWIKTGHITYKQYEKLIEKRFIKQTHTIKHLEDEILLFDNAETVTSKANSKPKSKHKKIVIITLDAKNPKYHHKISITPSVAVNPPAIQYFSGIKTNLFTNKIEDNRLKQLSNFVIDALSSKSYPNPPVCSKTKATFIAKTAIPKLIKKLKHTETSKINITL